MECMILNGLWVFEIAVLGNRSGPRWDEVAGEWEIIGH